ncbi:exodeoxyribonuclease VII large subunit [Candidatus Accumulibacter phosphatis]|jgi:exodeoxyribonuclease VII large subunit|uniref:Exodeoxyribonuclease 7 large subunit n=1 Tax=Candidatus Accumulibacter phosphatis TaxID=327160 RepID=A0ABX1TYC3_9PROT|nr:exodeoxyribonuclease VII large subunit [Candidatus Accumulibacter phosphatis]NMQ29276.1 exodeoxyribonuclease VII large subunit [Candidatus Accumulibacter phosphatis]
MADTVPRSNAFPTSPPVIPVAMLNRLARERLEAAFPLCWVAGEVSNLSRASSGHVYFSLKDAAAQVRCVMFRSRAQVLGWQLENGQQIEARVLVTLYEARGDFQLNVEAARRGGVGNLYEQFLRLKEKLEAEGLFASAGKRALPIFPRCVGVVSSLQAAALRDVLTTLARRAPQVSIVLYPTPVQGDGAGAQIADAIRRAGERRDCEVLIVCRGGGSMEDLWAFNDERVARAIHACPLPVICGVGHETDFSIADFAADQRAPTPTAAAELAAPEQAALLARLAASQSALRRQIEQLLEQRSQQLDWLARRLQHPAQYLAQHRERLRNLQRQLGTGLLQASSRARGELTQLSRRLLLKRPDPARHGGRLAALAPRLRSAWQDAQHGRRTDLERLAAGLAHLNPQAVLARGYSVVTNAQGEIVRDSGKLEPSARIAVLLHRGRVEAEVTALFADHGGPDGMPFATSGIASTAGRA